MSNNFTSNNIKKDESNLNIKDTDYINLITKLKEIKSIISLLGKTIFK